LGLYQELGLGNGYVVYGFEQEPTAVGLARFDATVEPSGRVALAWETAAETGLVGFHVERSRSAAGPYARLTRAPVAATGGPSSGASYRWLDSPGPGHAHYRLAVVNEDGRPERYGPVSVLVRLLRLFLPDLRS
jgi:hypothetical protein